MSGTSEALSYPLRKHWRKSQKTNFSGLGRECFLRKVKLRIVVRMQSLIAILA